MSMADLSFTGCHAVCDYFESRAGRGSVGTFQAQVSRNGTQAE